MKKMLALLMALMMLMTAGLAETLPEENAVNERVELSEFIGRDFDEVRAELGDVPVLGGDMLEAMNDQLRITCFYYHEAKVSAIRILDQCDYEICGVRMGMTLDEAVETLVAQGFTQSADMKYCVEYTSAEGNRVSIDRDDAGAIVGIEYAVPW